MNNYPIYKVEGIILKRRNYSEADRLITVFTKENGKIEVLAKGIRKINSKRAPHLELFRCVFLTIHKGKRFDTVIEAQSEKGLEVSDLNLEKAIRIYYLSEITDQLTPLGEYNIDIYDLLHATLSRLINTVDITKQEIVVSRYGMSLLYILGYISKNEILTDSQITKYIEYVTERKIKSKQLLHKIYTKG